MATYNGDNNDNFYDGTAQDDFIYGYGGNDSLWGNDGNDTLNGGTGDDTLGGLGGNDTYLIAKNDGADDIYDNGGVDVVKFTDLASTGITQVSRVAGLDLQLNYGGNSQLYFWNYFESADYHIEQFQFSDGVVWGWADIKAHISQAGTSGNDGLYGYDDSDDHLSGLAGNDWLFGYAGNDTLNGGTGNDYLEGGQGNDTYLFAKNDGADTLYDEGGADVVKFTDVTASGITQISRITYNSTASLQLNYSGGQLTIQGYFDSADNRIEQFQFSDGTVWGWTEIKAKVLQGTAGNDWLYGYDDSDDTLNGLAGNDYLSGGQGNDTLNGGSGNDTLYGGLGNDTYLFAKNDGADTLYDEGGADVVKFTDVAASGVTQVSRTNYNGNDLLLSYSGSQLTVYSYFASANTRIEQIQFSDDTVWGWTDITAKFLHATSGNDTLYGFDGGDDTLNGLAGNDTLYGYGGNDTLNGGTGNDYLNGGSGNDTYLFAKNDGVDTLYDESGTNTFKFTNLSATDISVSRIDYNNGYYPGNTLLLTYSGGQLTVEYYFYSTSNRIGQFQFSDGTVWGWADIKAHISLTGTSGDDQLYGYDDSNDTLNGLAGNDTLYGYVGNDTLNGGTGNDTLIGGSGNDTYLFAKNDGADTLYDESGTDTVKFTNLLATDISQVSRIGYDGSGLLLAYSGGQLTVHNCFSSTAALIEQFQFSDGVVWSWADIKAKALQGTAGNDTLYGYNDSNDTLNGLAGNDILYGYAGDDSLNGGTGDDILIGGSGNDSYWLDSAADKALEYGGDGIDSVYSSVGWRLSANVENLTLLAGAAFAVGNGLDNILTGNAANNILQGGDGNDSLNGGDGNDNLRGDGGNDILNGGNGVDIANYENASAGVAVNLSLTTAQNTLGAGTDTLSNIEIVNGSAYNDTLTGSTANNVLDGGAGNDSLNGGDGDDSLRGDAGNDSINGGNGVDTVHYATATAGVVVNLGLTGAQNTGGAGIDTLSNIENLNGSTYNDTLTGSAANNSLWGGTGNDVLNGGLGNDVLVGGLGQDRFVFSSALGLGNTDTVTDFTVADDTIQLAHGIFTALGTGTLAADQFKIFGNGAAVEDSNDHILYNSTSGGLFYDSDGSGKAAVVLVALLGKGLAMTSADFLVV